MSILRQCPRSPAAAVPPLEDDDLLSEILLRLPPQPSSLPRASAVCTRWRGIASDPGFSRRFRRHHRRNPPPLLGFFGQVVEGMFFQPTMEPPNRVPPGRFSMPRDHSRVIGCRHGLVLSFHQELKQVLVWDPVSGDLHSLAVPPGFDADSTPRGVVVRAAGHFRVVLLGCENQQRRTRAFACVYSSETGLWSNVNSTLIPSMDFTYIGSMPAVLCGDSFYWTLVRTTPPAILEFDLNRQSLAVVHLPLDKFRHLKPWNFAVMPAEGGGLGLLVMSDWTAQLWNRNTDCDGVASWVLSTTIELDKLLPLNSEAEGEERQLLLIIGIAEYNNVAFLYNDISLFMVHLQSLKFKKLSKPSLVSCSYPFESTYAAGNS